MLKITKDYGGNIEWNIGALFAHDKFVIDLYDVCKDMGLDFPINYVFGGLPCKFQGGRIPPRDATLDNAMGIISEFNKRGIGVRLTFSNYFISEDDIKNEVTGIKLLEFLNKEESGINGVIVSNDLLARFIKKYFTNLTLIASQVKPSIEVGFGDNKDTASYYNKLFDLYDIVVVNPFKVNDIKFLNELEHHDRVEFITNHRCVPNCSRCGVHYATMMELVDKKLADLDTTEEYKRLDDIMKTCEMEKSKFPLAGNQMSDSEVEMLVRMGFNKFKIEGRDNEPITFVRDLGDYVFVHNLFNRISGSILKGTV